MKQLYADVIVEISQDRLDRTFQYRIPEEMQGRVTTGSCVQVPFGNGGRMLTGYVLSVTDTPACEENRIKDLAGFSDRNATAGDRLMKLAVWMHRTYGSTMIRSIRTVLPVTGRAKAKKTFWICPAVPESRLAEEQERCEKKHQTARARLLHALRERERISRTEAGRTLKTTPAVLQPLQKAGLIRLEEGPDESVREKRTASAGQPAEQEALRLTEAQSAVYEGIRKTWSGDPERPVLLHGITGSGKTLIYLKLTEDVLKSGKQAIILIPEISLSWQTVQRFRERFGDTVSVLHSRLTEKERRRQLERAMSGVTSVMIGPRSALFTPFSNLGLIVIDEEQEQSYRNEETPRYDAREAAVMRGKLEGANVLFGSATPSIDSFDRAEKGIYRLFTLRERFGGAGLPRVRILDMKEEIRSGNRSLLSNALQEEIGLRLERNEQVLLFLNKRGFSGFVTCRSCGYVAKCPHCDVSLTYHKNGRLICHYCGYQIPMMKNCPDCGSPHISGLRAGTEQAEQAVKRIFPAARVLRMDSDTTKKKDAYGEVLSDFSEHKADVLVGTQMIVKGHDFPNVTLVGVLMADLSLFEPGFRAAERTYQLLVQCVGRAGRGKLPGEALIQTYHPEHYSIRAAEKQDYEAFFRQEMSLRSLMHYPPASHMLAVHASALSEKQLRLGMNYLKKFLKRIVPEGVQLIGPAVDPVAKVKDRFRETLYVKDSDGERIRKIRELLDHYIEINSGYDSIRILYDLDA